MSLIPKSPTATAPAGQEAIYAYRYVNKASGETYMFVKNFGQGQESAAQLVKNTATGEILVRKVVMALYRRHDLSTPLRPKQPREIEMLQKLQSWPDLPGVPRLFSHCYSHEYQKAKEPSVVKVGTLYRSVGLWKLCNGGAVISNSQLGVKGDLIIKLTDMYPMAAIGRLIWQIIGSFHFLGHGNPDGVPVHHRDAHLGNVFMHWSTAPVDLDKPSSLLPDFVLGDFGEAVFQNDNDVNTFMDSPCVDIERLQYSLLACLEELGLMLVEKKNGHDPVWHVVQGAHRQSSLKLLDISNAIGALVDEYNMTQSRTYPDLMPLVKMGKDLEAMCLPGGVDADLMHGPVWQKFVTDRRAEALAVSSSPHFTLRATKEQALKPFNPITGEPMELFAPWTLCQSVWKVVQDCAPPPTDPRAGKFIKTLKPEDYYSTLDSWDLLPVIEEESNLPVQQEARKGRLLDRLILSGSIRKSEAAEGDTFTVALDDRTTQDFNQWKKAASSKKQSIPELPGTFPPSDISSGPSTSSSSEPSKASTSSHPISPIPKLEEIDEEDFLALAEEMEANFPLSSSDEDDNTNFRPSSAMVPLFIPTAPPPPPQPQPPIEAPKPSFVPFGYTNGVDDYPEVTAKLQKYLPAHLQRPQPAPPIPEAATVTEEAKATKEVVLEDKINRLEKIQTRLHHLVHEEGCTCESWHTDIATRLDYLDQISEVDTDSVRDETNISQPPSSREASPERRKSSSTTTDEDSESSPPTGPDNSSPEDDTPEEKTTNSAPAQATPPTVVRRQLQRWNGRLPLPVPVSSRQRAAANATPSRLPVRVPPPPPTTTTTGPQSSQRQNQRRVMPIQGTTPRTPTTTTTTNTPRARIPPAPLTTTTTNTTGRGGVSRVPTTTTTAANTNTRTTPRAGSGANPTPVRRVIPPRATAAGRASGVDNSTESAGKERVRTARSAWR